MKMYVLLFYSHWANGWLENNRSSDINDMYRDLHRFQESHPSYHFRIIELGDAHPAHPSNPYRF